jgi:hypothetical protein
MAKHLEVKCSGNLGGAAGALREMFHSVESAQQSDYPPIQLIDRDGATKSGSPMW